MNIVLDLDGCIFDFNTAYAKLLAKSREGDKLPAGWKTDPALLAPVWDWDTLHGYSEEVQREVWEQSILPAKKNFWRKLGLLPGAKETLIQLDLLTREDHNLYFMTHRMGETAKYQTEKALYEVGISYPTVLLCNPAYKSDIALALECDVFIEDKLETVMKAEDSQIPNIYLIDAPYNAGELLSGVRVVSVKEALEHCGLWTT